MPWWNRKNDARTDVLNILRSHGGRMRYADFKAEFDRTSAAAKGLSKFSSFLWDVVDALRREGIVEVSTTQAERSVFLEEIWVVDA